MHYRGTNTSLKQLIFLLLLLTMATLFPGSANAIGGAPLWSSTDAVVGKHEAKAMVVDSSGNTIVVGYTGDNANDYYVAKFKADGSGTAWPPVTFGGTGDDVATAVTVDSKDNIIVTGYTWNGSDKDIHTVKYCGSANPAADCPGKNPGDLLWQHTLTNTSGNDTAAAVAVDSSDNIYVAGSYFNGVQAEDYVVVKYPSTGAVPTWTELFGDDVANPNKINKILAMTINSTGIAVTGYSGRGTVFDMITRKYGFDQSLVRSWRHSDSGDCMGKAIKMDTAGNVIVTGSGTNALGNKDIYTVKYDPASDTPTWEKTYNGNSTDEPVGLWVDSTGDVYVIGVTNTLAGNDDFYTARYNGSNGALTWQAIFDAGNDATDIPVGIVVDDAADGGVFVTGYSTVTGNDDFITLKYRKDTGVLLWEKAFNGSDNKNDHPIGIALEPAGGPVPRSVYVAGWSDSTAAGYNYQVVKYDYGALNAPSNLTAAAASDTSITLTWYDNSTNEEKFVIERKQGESGTWGAITPDKTSSAPPNDTTVIPTVPATTYTDSTGLVANNYYYYRIRAWNSANTYSDYSNEARALTKVVSYADPAWSYIYNGADNRDDVATAITFDTDNHPVVTGYSDLTEEGVEGMYSYDYMTFKLDRADKSIKWKARYDSGDGGTDMAAGVTLDSSGNVIVTGTAYLAGGGDKSDELYTRKVATAGLNDPAATPAFMWHHQYGTLNGIDMATAIAMVRDGSNNSVVIGHGGNSAVPQDDDIFIIKYANDGSRPWIPEAIVYDSGRNDLPSAMAFDASGNIFITGYSYDKTADPSGSFDWFTAKYNGATGALIWSDVFDSGFGADKALSIDVDKDGNAYVTGYAKNSDGNFVFHTIKYDGALVPAVTRRIWSSSYNKTGFDARAVAVKVDPIDGAVVVGGTSYVNATDSDFHLIRYNPADGSENWNMNFDRAGYDYATVMTMDASGYIYLAGNSRTGPDTDSDFDASADVLSLIYDYEGTFLGAMSYGGAAGKQDEAAAITVNNIGEAFVAGYSRNANATLNKDYIVLKQINSYLLAPGAFTATTQADYTKMDLSWQVPASGPSFKIFRTPGPSNPLSVWTLVSSPGVGAVSYPDTTVPLPGTNYCYTIEAISGSLNSRKTETCATTRLAKPTTLTLTVDSTTQISLNWTQIDNNTGYKVERKTGAGGTWADLAIKTANTNSHVDNTLAAGTTYYYRVSTNNVSGYSLPSTEMNAITKPVAPTLNAPTGITNTQMVLGWNAPTGAATYTLQKKLSTDPDTSYANITTPNNCTNIATTSCTVSGLTPNTTYNFRVMATNSGGSSVWSNVQPGTAALAVPTWGTTPTNITNTGMTMTWVNPAVTGSGTITYTLQYRLSSGSYVDETTASACAGTTALTCSVTGLTPNRTYYYRIKASNASGSSNWSTEKSGVTLLDTPTLSTAAGGALKVDLTWTAVSEATGYTVQQSLCTNSADPTTCRGVATSYAAFSNKGTTTGNGSTSFSAASLAAGSNYRYQIIATAGGNSSAASNILHAWTNLTPPTLTVTPASSTALTLSWDAQPGETNYTVEVSTTGIGGAYSAIPAATGLAINTLTYPHTGLALATEYCYQVKAYSTEAVPPPAVYSTPKCKTTPPNAPALSATQTQYESSYTVIQDTSKYWTLADYWINRPVVITSGANTYTKNIAGSVNSAFYASPAFTTETISAGDSYAILQTVSGKATGYDGGSPTNSLIDSDKNWGMHEWKNFKVKILNSATASKVGQVFSIAGNGGNNIYISTTFPSLIESGDTYQIAQYFGTAAGEGVSTTQLVDTANTWPTIDLAQDYYLMMTSGNNAGHARKITAKTATTFTTDPFSASITEGDTYIIAPVAWIGPHFGKAEGSPGTSKVQLVDTNTWWNASYNYTGNYLVMTSGANKDKARRITSNTTTAINVASAFDNNISATDYYMITPNFLINTYFGKAVGAGSSTTQLVDTANNWLTDWSQGGYYLMMTSGANADQFRSITAKTADTLTVSPAFASAINPNDTYLIGTVAAAKGTGTITTTVVPGATHKGSSRMIMTNDQAEFYSLAPAYANNYNYQLLGLKDPTILAGNFDTQFDYTILDPLVPADSLATKYLVNTYASFRFDFQSPASTTYNTYIHRGRLPLQDNGRSTAYNATIDTLYDTRTMAGSTTAWKNWAVDQWKDYYLQMTSGPNNQLVRKITANTANSITLDSPFPNNPASVTSSAIGAGSTNTKLVDTSKSWSANAWVSYYLYMTSGANAGQALKIISSDATSVTVAGTGFASPIVIGDSYKIFNVDAYRINVIAGSAATNGSTQDGKNSTNAVLVDSSNTTGSTLPAKNWAVDQWKNFYLYMSTGRNIGEFRTILSNTANSITVDPPFPYQIASGDSYMIFDPRIEAQAIEVYWVSIYEPITWVTEQLIIPNSDVAGRIKFAKSGDNILFYTAPSGGAWQLRRQLELKAGDAYTPNLYWIYQLGRIPHTAGTSERVKINNFQLSTPTLTSSINFSNFSPEIGHVFRRATKAPALTESSLEISWNKIDTVLSYEVERCPSTDHQNPTVRTVGACSTFTQDQPVDGSTRIINTTSTTGMTAGYTYRFRSRAKYNATDYTAWSNEQWYTVTPPASTMTAPAAGTATSAQLTPTWTNVNGDNGYKLYWKKRSGATCTDDNWNGPIYQAINTTTFNHTGLSAGTFYCYKIKAIGPSSGQPVTPDSASSNMVFQTTRPAKPTQPTLSGVTASSITLNWAPNVTGNTGYNVERKTGAGGTWASVGTVGADVTSFTNNTGLSPGTVYYYRVSANSASGYSVTSDEQYTTTTPAAPVVTASVISFAQIDLTWPLTLGATEYRVEQKIGAGGAWVPIDTITKDFTQSYCGYPVPRINCASLIPDSSAKSVTGLTENTYYCYQVKSWNTTGGESAASIEKCATTSAMPLQNLSATALDGGFKIRLDWVPFVCLPIACDAPTGYELQRQVWDDNWVLLKTLDGTTLTYTDKIAIDPKKQYRYRVRSISGADTSPYSEVTVSAKPYSAEANVCTE